MSDDGQHRGTRTGAALGAAVAGLALLLGACAADDEPASTPSGTADRRAAARERREARAAARQRATVRGAATLDGAPFDADFLGVVVRDDGLATPCPADLPPVVDGTFEVHVYAASEGDGCGRPGTELLLWVAAGDQRLFSTSTAPWPGDGAAATFDATFSTATPRGAAPLMTDLAGGARDRTGRRVEPGTTIEALVGGTRCGVSTTRDFGDELVNFSMSVVGPDARPGCDLDMPIQFRIDGDPVAETIPNDGDVHREVSLTVE